MDTTDQSRLAGLLLACACVVLTGAAPGQGARPHDGDPTPPQSAVRAGLEVTTAYDSNVFATPTDEQDDVLVLLSPSFEYRSAAARRDLVVDAGATLGRYRDNGDEDFDDYWLNSRARYKLDRQVHVFGSLGTRRDHEGRDSPDDDRSGDRPTTVRTHHGDLGAVMAFGDHQLRLGGAVEALRFDNVPSGDGTLINEDRDRDQYELGLRLARRLTPGLQVFAQAQYDIRDYQWATDIYGFDRDSRGYRVAVGAKQGSAGEGALEAFVGYLHQRYDDPAFDDVGTLDLGVTLNRPLGAQTGLSAELRRDLLETTQFGSPGYLLTDLELALTRQIDERLQLRLDAYYGDLEYRQVARDERLLSLGAALEYAFSPAIYAVLDYRWTRRRGDDDTIADPWYDDGLDYDRHFVSVTLGASFSHAP